MQLTKNGLAYYRQGQGQPIVLIHGVGLRAESWAKQIEVLSKTNTVWAIDLPGHGQSKPLPMLEPGIDDYIHCLKAFIDEVIAARVYLAGHSMGGLLALAFSGMHPKMSLGVAALNTVYKRSDNDKKSIALRLQALITAQQATTNIEATLNRWFGDINDRSNKYLPAAKKCRKWLSENEFKGYADAYRVFAQEDGVPENTLKEISTPVLYLTGSLDANSNTAMSAQMSDDTPLGRNASIVGSGHLTQMTHADELNALLAAFIDDCQSFQVYKSQ